MQLITVISIIGASGLTYSLINEEKAFKILNTLIVVGCTLVLIGTKSFKAAGMFSILLGISIMTGYIIYRSDLNKKQRELSILSGIFVLLSIVPKLMHWPGGALFSLICVIPVVLAVVWLLSNTKKDPSFLSPLIVTVPLCLIEFVRMVQAITE